MVSFVVLQKVLGFEFWVLRRGVGSYDSVEILCLHVKRVTGGDKAPYLLYSGFLGLV